MVEQGNGSVGGGQNASEQTPAVPAVQQVSAPAAGPRESVEKKSLGWFRRNWLRLIVTITIISVVSLWAYLFLGKMMNEPDFSWKSMKMIGLYLAAGIVFLAVVGLLVLIKISRTRLDKEKGLHANKDINDWLVIFNWSRKILYVPLIITGFITASLMLVLPQHAALYGRIWFLIWLGSFFVEEFKVSLMSLVIFFGTIVLGSVILFMMGLFGEFSSWLGNLDIYASSLFYVLFSIAHLLVIFVSYMIGLFRYISIEPNQVNIQEGFGHDGQMFDSKKCDVFVDASKDFVEWLFGVGKIRISFPGSDRMPITYLVGRIKNKARFLEGVRAVTAIDGHLSR